MLNKVILMGRLTAAPELRKTNTDVSVTNFTIAVDRNYSANGARMTDFLNVVCWRETAEFVAKYFSKGQLIAVEGSIQVRTYEGKDGNNHKATDIVADRVYFAENKKQNGDEQNAFQTADFEQPTLDIGVGDEPDADDDLPF